MPEITRDFLMKHRTDAGAWTKAQFAIIGIEWPPIHGWITRVLGLQITDKQAEDFAKLNVPKRRKDKRKPACASDTNAH